MKQLVQELKKGKMDIEEVPWPILSRGQVLVHNHFSVISAGTEGKSVADARKGYLAKARSRPKEVLQVVAMVKTSGLLGTYRMVMNKLDAASPLGYSCAGEIIAVGEGVTDLRVGDFVACGGQGAYHAEIVAVYRRLCAKIPAGVLPRHAALTTIGAIAMQGIRQADLRVGETCAIIGLGLIGQLSGRILRAAGVRTVGIDIDERQIRSAHESSVTLAVSRNQMGLEKTVLEFTSGLGVDAVIITAGSSSTDPVELAGVLCRPKGKVIIVGAVPTGFSRAQYYKKELDLRMSCSYGPGRYDPVYEEKGVDYPAGYVRWTENRNMQAFLELLETKSVAVEDIITHTFPLRKASEAYQMIMDKNEHYLGILIEYDHSPSAVQPARSVTLKESGPFVPNEPAVGFIGTGNFAQNILLPRLHGSARLVGLSEAMGHVARKVATKYGFAFCTDSPEELIRDPRINTIFIVTRHNLHAPYVIQALQAGKNVYVEKPLALTEPELEDVRRAYETSSGNARLMVGFNRRFAPFIRKTAALLTPGAPKAIQFRINAGAVPPGGWVNDPEVGGGRIVGEVCHFVDLAAFLAGGKVEAVQSWSMKDSTQSDNTLTAVLRFTNGSIAGLSYFSNGSNLLPKERLEVFFGGTSVVIDDFRSLTVYGSKATSEKSKSQDKGHTDEIRAFLESIRTGAPSPISFPDLLQSMRTTFKIVESLRSNRCVFLEETVESPAGPEKSSE